MQIERTVCGVTALGPGMRIAVWVNGCPRRCKRCVSPTLQMPEPRNECEVKSYFSKFDFKSYDGLTVSGGEPFYQAGELEKLVDLALSNGMEDILVYTGYTLEELHAKQDETIERILKKIAVLIDGEYIIELDDGTGNLAGSSNQRVVFLKEKFKPLYDGYYSKARKMQIFELGNYKLAVGIPDRTFIEEFNKR